MNGDKGIPVSPLLILLVRKKEVFNVWQRAGVGCTTNEVRNEWGRGEFFHGWQGRPNQGWALKVARVSRSHERQARRSKASERGSINLIIKDFVREK